MAFVLLERSDIFLKEILKLISGERSIDHLEDHSVTFIVVSLNAISWHYDEEIRSVWAR